MNPRKVFVVAVGVAILLTSAIASAQSGMTRDEFYRKLESYFDRELIGDLDSAFPDPRSVTFYSWDAGDFSGDGNYDLACVVRHRAEKDKRLWVYLFVDTDGFLTLVTRKEYRFVELPLEVGVVVRYGVCYVTEKLQQFNWRITGFRFDGIALLTVSEYRTQRVGSFTLDRSLDYMRLQIAERVTTTLTGNLAVERKCAVVPIYPRGVIPGHGYRRRAQASSIDYVQRGAYYWSGPDDCSTTLAGAYDTSYLYLTIAVRDDEVVTAYCDTCPADRLELWFDLYMPDSTLPSIALRREKRGVSIRRRPDAPLVGIGIHLGNFDAQPASVKLLVSDSSMLTRLRMKAFADVAIHAERQSEGYVVRLRIPWLLMSGDRIPPFRKPTPLGVLVSITDVDNEFRPEEATIFCNAMYDPSIVATEGELVILPEGEGYGNVEYVYAERIVEQLQRGGF
ncbi:MAG: hypothetical protein N3B17_08070 [Chlorobi bacterium]|nr:hypothetical protein [Chlorobiota bacterium]